MATRDHTASDPADPDRSASHTAPTFAEAWRTWLAYRRAGPRPMRDSTLADYESVYRRYLGPALGTTPLDEIDGAEIVRLTIAISGASLSAKRLSNILIPLRACLRWHQRMGLFERDPSPWFECSAPAADERRMLSIEQVERLIAATPEQHRAFVATAAYTGMRAGELRALTWRDIDLVRRTALVNKTYYRDRLQRSTKTGHDRTVPLPPHLATLLESWRQQCPPSSAGLVFPGASGGPLDLDIFRARVFRPAVRAAGLPEGLRIHDLRHTSASLYLRAGATVREVMEIHGWSQMQTALRYLHTGDDLARVADRLSSARDAAGCATAPEPPAKGGPDHPGPPR